MFVIAKPESKDFALGDVGLQPLLRKLLRNEAVKTLGVRLMVVIGELIPGRFALCIGDVGNGMALMRQKGSADLMG